MLVLGATDELLSAVTAGDGDAVEAIVRRDPDQLDATAEGVSVVRVACYRGHAEVGRRLVELGAGADVFDAAALGDVDRLRLLLDDAPERATAIAADGFSPLHLAAWFGHPRAAELLLGRGADPEQVATNGTELRPLHSAAAGGHAVIAHLLLDRGADIEAAQQGGVRALHSAAHRDDVAMVALLLERGADPAATTGDGRTARDLTTSPEVLALLP